MLRRTSRLAWRDDTPKVECRRGAACARLNPVAAGFFQPAAWAGKSTLAWRQNSIQHGLILAEPLLLGQQRRQASTIRGER
jgi:hypothetical protein